MRRARAWHRPLDVVVVVVGAVVWNEWSVQTMDRQREAVARRDRTELEVHAESVCWIINECLCSRAECECDLCVDLCQYAARAESGIKRVAVENSRASRMHATTRADASANAGPRTLHLNCEINSKQSGLRSPSKLFLCLHACNSTSLMSTFWIAPTVSSLCFAPQPQRANCLKQKSRLHALYF